MPTWEKIVHVTVLLVATVLLFWRGESAALPLLLAGYIFALLRRSQPAQSGRDRLPRTPNPHGD